MIVSFSIINKEDPKSLQMPLNLLVAYSEEWKRKIQNFIGFLLVLILGVLLFLDHKLYMLSPGFDWTPVGGILITIGLIGTIYWSVYNGPKNVLLLACFTYDDFDAYLAAVKKNNVLSTKQKICIETLYEMIADLNENPSADLKEIIRGMSEYSEVFKIIRIRLLSQEKANKTVMKILKSRFNVKKR